MGPSVRHRSDSDAGPGTRSAALIQHQLLSPSLYIGRYVDLAAKASPCRIVGGDFFDYQDTGGHFRLALGDVCGKGAPAASRRRSCKACSPSRPRGTMVRPAP